jgi:hypothetical protein
MLRCTGNNSSREYLGGFSSWLWMGGFFFLVSYYFSGTFSFSLVSATSSYADDIAHT